MFESKDSTLGIYNRVDVNQLGYCNAFIRKCYLRDINGFILTKCELVSYCTPVVAITYNLDGTQKKKNNYCVRLLQRAAIQHVSTSVGF